MDKFAKDPEPAFYIQNIPVMERAILSPMAGFSDLPFRSLCRGLGSGMSYTEFISAKAVLRGLPPLERKLAYLPEERPVVYQLFDNNPQRLLEAALRLQERGPDVIDINMGCSTRKVSGRGAGAGLLRSPLKIARIFKILSRALEVPVTGKIRLGWDEDTRNGPLIARIIEENGGALVAVHGRTKAQKYAGAADWDAIAEIKAAVSLPVIGNGDINRAADVDKLLAFTGCEGVMIARGAIGNPWIFAGLDREQVPPGLVRETMALHLERMQAFYGPNRGLVLFRKHAVRYLSPLGLPDRQRRRLLTCESPTDFFLLLDEIHRAVPVRG